MSGRVLIVDDDPSVLRTVQRVLALEGHAVEAAPSGLAALRALSQGSYDLVISDLNMRPLDGLELLRRLRLTHPTVPFILMSGAIEVEDVARAMRYGLSNLLLKPVQVSMLREAVAASLATVRRSALADALVASPDMTQLWGVARSTLQMELDGALTQLGFHFQPIVDVQTGEVVASEALVRPPAGRLSSPLALLEAARRLDRLPALEEALLLQAHDRFVEQGAPHRLFLNASVSQLLRMTSHPPGWVRVREVDVVIELTERERPPPPGPLVDGIRSLRRFGVGLAVDDLGAGHAGLLSALALAPDFVKLDRALTELVGVRPEAAVELANLLSDRWGSVIAEGVETEAEARAWADAGINLQQGFFHARPAARVVRTVKPLPAELRRG